MKKSIFKVLPLILIILLLSSCLGYSGKILQVNFLNVGQADSIFIMLPNGQNMLIDAGLDENGDQIVKFIKKKNVSKIDYLIATHPHADHIGGMDTVVKKLDIGKVYMPKVSNNTKQFKDLLEQLKEKNLKVITAKAGVEILHQGRLDIKMLAPVGTNYADLNDYSAVIKLTYNKRSFLFMGDAGFASENQITGDISADVLKVGHHGSETSTSEAFLKRVKPTYAVISVGKDNTYNHPNEGVVNLLERNCLEVFRTDKDGTIVIKTNGKDLNVKH